MAPPGGTVHGLGSPRPSVPWPSRAPEAFEVVNRITATRPDLYDGSQA